MGYESKLIVVNKYSFENARAIGETVAELNLAEMGSSFFPIKKTFENEIEKPVYIGDWGEVTEDKYGDRLRYTTAEKLLKVLYKCEVEEHYRRTELAINTLKTFLSKDWENIIIVHYGY